MQVIASWTAAKRTPCGRRSHDQRIVRRTSGRRGPHCRVLAEPARHDSEVEMQEVLDAALDQAPDRVKAQFSLLVSETIDGPGDQPYTGGPFSVSLEDMTSPEWTGDERAGCR